MPTHPRKHSEDIQIAAEILKEAAEPRLSSAVKNALDKKKVPVTVALRTLGGNKGGKTRAVKA